MCEFQAENKVSCILEIALFRLLCFHINNEIDYLFFYTIILSFVWLYIYSLKDALL